MLVHDCARPIESPDSNVFKLSRELPLWIKKLKTIH